MDLHEQVKHEQRIFNNQEQERRHQLMRGWHEHGWTENRGRLEIHNYNDEH